ncbi:MAG: FHA domain-containing protein [Planctomycetota bacterium]
MAADPPFFALRCAGLDHALEPGRTYLLGAAEDCDLRLGGEGVAPHHARLAVDGDAVAITDLAPEFGMLRNGFRVDAARLAVGDAVQCGPAGFTIVADEGQALVVPIPAMRRSAALRRQVAAIAAPAWQRRDTHTFQELVAAELRRGPWLLISAALHALLLLLFWLFYPRQQEGGTRLARMSFDLGGGQLVAGEAAPAPPTIAREEPPLDVTLPDDPVEVTKPPEVADPEPVPDRVGALQSNPRIAVRAATPPTPRATRRGDGPTRDLAGLGSDGFKKTVAQLRKSGLEIVFVFDSTGSMGMTIKDTKDTIADMLDVLRALVPDATVGLVTYRDRGRNESYVVRQMPLGRDYWHAANFVQDVQADGGGDRPEAVRDGLRAAFGQNWAPGSKRVVILAGDAPAHDREWQRLLREVKDFAAGGNSFVHTLVTSPRDAGVDTHEQFEQIAKAGGGECLDLEQSDHVMQRVLALAFGRQFDGDLAAVRHAVAQGRTETKTWALDLARRGGPELAAALADEPVPAALLNALVRLKRRSVALELIDLLGRSDTPPATRHAIAWAVQRMLDLPLAPIDPENGRPPDSRDLVRLRQLATSTLQ